MREQSMREMVAKLQQFEGYRCLWRLPLAALTYVLPGLLFVAASVLGAFVASGEFHLVAAVLAAVVAGGAAVGARRVARLRVHRNLVAQRLWTFEKPNPATEVPVLLRSSEMTWAKAALREARFNPQDVGLAIGAPPVDAPELDYKIGVQEPAAWPQSASDADRVNRIAAVLRAAGVRSRIAGIDIRPPAN